MIGTTRVEAFIERTPAASQGAHMLPLVEDTKSDLHSVSVTLCCEGEQSACFLAGCKIATCAWFAREISVMVRWPCTFDL